MSVGTNILNIHGVLENTYAPFPFFLSAQQSCLQQELAGYLMTKQPLLETEIAFWFGCWMPFLQ
jgi:hypothetical protein